METAVIPGLYLIAFVDFDSSSCDRKGQSYPVEYYLESTEEYSEGKIHMSEPEAGNGNVNIIILLKFKLNRFLNLHSPHIASLIEAGCVNAMYFVNQATGNTRISRTEFVYDEQARDCKFDLSE